MKPSVFASFVVFLCVGGLALYSYPFNTDSWVRFCLVACAFSSALYYYYLNVATEQKWDARRRAPRAEILTWWITALQYVAILCLWPALRLNWIAYAATLLFMYVSYIVWDIVHRDLIAGNAGDGKARCMFLFDVLGCLLAASLLAITLDLPPQQLTDPDSAHHAMLILTVALLLTLNSLLGFCVAVYMFHYSPFAYLRMDGTAIRALQESASAETTDTTSLPFTPNSLEMEHTNVEVVAGTK